MGKLSSPSHHEPTINHFTHPHPLNLSVHHSFNASSPCCTICNFNLSGLIYTCTPCNYNLHINCAQMPQQIRHQSHQQQHPLSLLPKPAYPEGLFTCNACGKQGNGFNYHCRSCKFDLHIKCASIPLKVTHQSHRHSLDLTFSIPYQNNIFSCDVCKNMGSNEWLYRCNSCEFDSHLNCATMEPRLKQFLGTQFTEKPNLMNNFSNQGVYGRGAEENEVLKVIMEGIATNNSQALMAMQAMIRNSYAGSSGANYFQPPVMGGGSGSAVDFLGGVNGSGGANHLQALMGGGGGGANHLQALMGGGGGGGGANNLQALMGGGGGGANIYQAMMGGGGVSGGGVGGGTDLLQAMMGGGTGGGLNGFGRAGGDGAGNLLQAFMGGGGGSGGVADLLGGGGGAGNLLQAFMGGGGGGGGGVADLLGGGGGLSVDSLSGILGSLSGLGGLG